MTEPASSPQEAGAPLASLVDKLLDNVLWSDSDPEWLERALPAVVELIEPDLLPVLEANLDYWQRRAETAEAALASREAEVRRQVAAGLRTEAGREEEASWPESAARVRSLADRIERGDL